LDASSIQEEGATSKNAAQSVLPSDSGLLYLVIKYSSLLPSITLPVLKTVLYCYYCSYFLYRYEPASLDARLPSSLLSRGWASISIAVSQQELLLDYQTKTKTRQKSGAISSSFIVTFIIIMSGNILTHKAPIIFDGFSSTSEEDAVMEEEQKWRETTSKRKIAIKRKQRAITTTTFSSRQKKKQKQAKGLRLDHSDAAAAARLPVPRPNTPITNPVSNHHPTMVQTSNRSSKVGLQVLQQQQQQQQQYFPTPWGMSAVDSSFARQPQHHHNRHESATRSTTSTRQMDNTNTTITGTTEIHLKRIAETSRTHSAILHDGDGYPGGASTSALPHGTSPGLQGSSSASANNSCQRFVIDANAPFLALLEGVQASSSSTTMDDYIANVIQEQRHSQLRHSQHHYPPRTARMMELPCEAKLGNWSAELVPPPKVEQALHESAAAAASTTIAKNANTNAMNASNSAVSLQGYRMSFRHHSCLSLGPLRGKEDGNSATSGADSAAHSALTVSLIHPNLNRFSSVQCQGIVANLDQFPQSFIGSLSIVGFDGFTCSSDMNSRAGEVSASFLKRVKSSMHNQTAPDRNISSAAATAAGSSSSSSSQIYHPSLMGITGQNAQHSIGTSVLCGLSLDTDYQVWIGQDQGTCGQNNNPIVAVDSK
jgi:hypothetical protein